MSDKKEKKVTIRTVAEDAGVSVAAVSKVLRNAYGVSDALREKVEESIAKLGYRPNTAARAMRGRSYTVGILMIDIGNPFLPPLIQEIAANLNALGYKTMMASGESDLGLETSLIESMIDFQLDGLILISPRMPGELLAKYAVQIPILVIGHHERSARTFDTVNSNEELGSSLATQELIDAGHTKIAMLSLADVAGSLQPEKGAEHRPTWGREEGYAATMRAAGLAPEILRIRNHYATGFVDIRIAELMTDQNRPTAFFCWSDLTAIPLLEECYRRGLRVPQDVAVTGYDNNTIASLDIVGLTSVDQNPSVIAKTSVKMLLSRIDGRTVAEHVLIDPELVRRRSSGPR